MIKKKPKNWNAGIRVTLNVDFWAAVSADPSNPFFALSQAGTTLLEKPVVNQDTRKITFYNITDTTMFTFTATKGLLAAGQEVELYPVFAAVAEAKLSDPVPAGIPGRLGADAEGDEYVKTWTEWIGSNQIIDLTDDRKGFALMQASGYIPGSSWITLVGADGYEILDTTGIEALTSAGGGE